MDLFSLKANAERQTVFQEAAIRQNVTPIIIEKDFWVCWTLKRLYETKELGPYLTFKGGTSLSKAFHLIKRFSEDIDLTISRDAPYLNDGKNPMEEDLSGKERERRIKSLKSNAQSFVTAIALPKLIDAIQTKLGHSNGWKVLLDEQDPDKQTLLFQYPQASNIGLSNTSYIQPQVKLEFGARGETEPYESRTIQPYVSEIFPQLFEDACVTVSTLAIERSFWEKVTILHSLYHGVKQRDRMSRHYYDVYMMEKSKIAEKALDNILLLEQVVRNKTLMFADTKASYHSAKIGSLRIIPNDEQLKPLKQDYQAMSEMFMDVPPSFEEIIEGLILLEQTLNHS
jgi:predicted nucleotidyltransferase component of viral defense system